MLSPAPITWDESNTRRYSIASAASLPLANAASVVATYTVYRPGARSATPPTRSRPKVIVSMAMLRPRSSFSHPPAGAGIHDRPLPYRPSLAKPGWWMAASVPRVALATAATPPLLACAAQLPVVS
jgi:hypothetical protein